MAPPSLIAPLTLIAQVARRRWRALILWGLGFALLFQLAMLGALILRFQDLPNYVTFYNWPANVWWIIQSTPAWADMPGIIAEEWLIEIGYMNYDYGVGLSEWSLNVVPSRLLLLFLLGALIGLCLALARQPCAYGRSASLGAATGLGALLVAMTNVTLSWVVCCATPTWVVGLAMLGLGVSTSLALETMGPPLTIAGFVTLGLTAYLLARRASLPLTALEKRHA